MTKKEFLEVIKDVPDDTLIGYIGQEGYLFTVTNPVVLDSWSYQGEVYLWKDSRYTYNGKYILLNPDERSW